MGMGVGLQYFIPPLICINATADVARVATIQLIVKVDSQSSDPQSSCGTLWNISVPAWALRSLAFLFIFIFISEFKMASLAPPKNGFAWLRLAESLSFVRVRLGSKLGSARISFDLGSLLVACLEAQRD